MVSNKYRDRLLKSIPGGAHVHTKSYNNFPANAPQIIKKSKGVYIYDENDNEILDFGMALRSVNIGYGEEYINNAVCEQLQNCNTTSLPTEIELLAAEKLISLINSAEMVKFAKDGSTVTTAAVKIARAYTQKDIVLKCDNMPFYSYNDWFIGKTAMNNGCLKDSYKSTLGFEYNNIQSVEEKIEQYPNQIACIILEPSLSFLEPKNNFLVELRTLCDKHNIVLIFDEMITGFRWDIKGAQHIYNIKPDLTTFGKAMGNGFSVSALAGKREIMSMGNIEKKDKQVFLLSATHGAEATGLAAFLATIDFLEQNDVVKHNYTFGNNMIKNLNDMASSMGISDGFNMHGRGCLPYYSTNNPDGQWDAKFCLLFQQEMMKHKVLIRHISIAYHHGSKEMEKLLLAFEKSMKVYIKAYKENNPNKYLLSYGNI